MYALVLEQDGFQVLIDPRDLWKPARVIVRRGYAQAEVWLDSEDISFHKEGPFGRRDHERILELVRENFDDLFGAWVGLKDDVRRDRLERNVLVD